MRISVSALCLLISLQVSGQSYCTFDGDDDFVSLAPAIFFSDEFSIEFTFIPRRRQAFSRIMDFGNGAGVDNVWIGFDWLSGFLIFEIFDQFSQSRITADKEIPLNQLSHVVATFNNGIGSIFLNGELVAEGALNSPANIIRNFNYLAKSNWPDPNHHFDLRNFRIWQKSLDLNDLKTLKDSILTGFEDGLRLAYNFTNVVADTIFDLSPSESNGLMKNGTSVVNCPLDSIRMIHELTLSKLDTLCMYETWERNVIIEAFATCLDTFWVSPCLVTWTIADNSISDFLPSNKIQGKQAGSTVLNGVFDGESFDFVSKVDAPIIQPTEQVIDSYLANPIAKAKHEIPVVIIRFLPTADGINLDVSKSPDFWSLNPISLADLQQDIIDYEKRAKYTFEEGSRFRGYKDPTAIASLGYKVTKIINVYENTPPGPIDIDGNGHRIYLADFHQIFQRFNLEHYINDLGIKEVWIWEGGFDTFYPSYDPNFHDPDDFRGGNESNMASPITGDISNSYRDPYDLPILDHTYIVYGHNFRRTQAEVAHVRGHQFEAMLSHINFLQDGNTDLFWKDFVGQDAQGTWITGRCGWTHMPPNTTDDYDYLNPLLVASDIEDWIPDGSGSVMPVNVDTWGNKPYQWPSTLGPFPQKEESQWYLYWFQSYPGFNNKIEYQSQYHMTNWWDIIGDWDTAILNGLGLYRLICDDNLLIPDPAVTDVYNSVNEINYSGMIAPENTVVFNSESGISLNPSFEVPSGTYFEASWINCGSEMSLSPMPNRRSETRSSIHQCHSYPYSRSE